MKTKLLSRMAALLLCLLPAFAFGQEATCAIVGDNTVCAGGTTLLCATANCATYEWSTGSTAQCIVVTGPGIYIVTITDENDEETECSKTISVSPEPTCNIESSGNICADGATRLCATVGSSSYRWSTGETTRCISVRQNGRFSVTVTNSSGCTNVCSETVEDEKAGDCSIIGEELDCTGGTTEICAAPGFAAYEWSTGATTRCITVSDPGTFSTTVTNEDGCESVCSRRIIRPTISCRIMGDNLSCMQGSTQLCATAGYPEYDWSTGETSRCINVSEPGLYRVTVTDERGCRNVCRKDVEIEPIPLCLVEPGFLNCADDETEICASTGYTTYEWSTGATTRCLTVGSAGNYILKATDPNGCVLIDTIVIGFAPNALSCSIVANGNSATVNVQGGTAPYAYRWSNNATTSTISGLSEGSYRVTVTDANGCSTSCEIAELGVCVNLTFAGSIGYDQYLCGPGADPEPIRELTPPKGGSGIIEYLWMKSKRGGAFNNIHWDPIPNSNTRDYDPGPLYETTYFLRCTRRADCPYIETNLVKIEVGDFAAPVIENPDRICTNTPITFNTYHYGGMWDFGLAATPRYAYGTSPKVTFASFGSFDITLSINYGGCKITVTKRIFVRSNCNNPTGSLSNDENLSDGIALTTSSILQKVNVFPNPVNDRLTVELPGIAKEAIQLQIMNVSGKVLQTLRVPGEATRQELDFAELPSGTYFVRVYSGEDVQVLKVMKN